MPEERTSVDADRVEGGSVPGRPARSGVVAVVVLVLLGLLLGAGPTLLAGFTICGISGCSGGGFGRSTDPTLTLALLVAAGVLAGTPLGAYGLRRRSGPLLGGALALAVVAGLTAGALVGSDLQGCPRNVPDATCLEEQGP